MVLSSPAADDAPRPDEPGWLDRLTAILRLADGGIIVLIDQAHPGRLGELVRALLPRNAGLEVHRDARRLATAEKGAVVVLWPDAAQVRWLNMERPVVSHREIRLVLFSDARTSAALAHGAVDFFHWISHRIECPGGPWMPAVRTIRGAVRARARGVAWWGEGFAEALEAALPGRPVSRISAALPYEQLVDAVRPAGRAWVEVMDADNPFRLRRVAWALAEAGRRGRVALLGPSTSLAGFWPAHARPRSPGAALAKLEAAGAARAGRLAALLDLEPEALDLAAAMLRGGVDEGVLEETAAQAEDGGAALACLAAARGIAADSRSPALRAGVPLVARGSRPANGQDWKSIHSRFREASVNPEALRAVVERALLVNDGEVAERWARRWLERRPEDAEALCALGKALRARRQLAAAIDVLRRAVALYERQPAPDPLRYGDALKQLGLSLYYDGTYADAAKPMRRALRLLREAHGVAHPSSVEALARLNDVVLSDGKYAEAEGLLKQAIELRNTVAGREREVSPWSLLHLGHILVEHERFAEAEGILRTALELVLERKEGAQATTDRVHRSLRSELGQALLGQERYAEAESFFRRAVAGFGGRDAEIPLRLASGYGEALAMQGKVAQAESVLRRALEGAGGRKDLPFYTMILAELGRIRIGQGRYVEAEPLFQEARAIEAQAGRTQSSAYVQSIQGLARIWLLRDGRSREAEELLREALAIEERSIGRDHPALGELLSDIAEALLEQRRFADAEPILKRALRIAESAGNRSGVGALLAQLAEVQASMKRRDAADTVRRAIAELSRELGADHPTTVDATFKLHALLERPS
ncbi:tetratricopeptide repeat protein [Sorangium sp. So ce1151]|uniref:tetratricopeptide repeat protein n=1 Tax=Sorangium sp. So ce1151 TaxID=3133332 RepID=UPI003F643EE6